MEQSRTIATTIIMIPVVLSLVLLDILCLASLVALRESHESCYDQPRGQYRGDAELGELRN
ncbi:hypothetical protein QBC44DRAFT_375127 [Cladorrhinum sp. PSN332]|nr:hypothetical protein QBC44DRAFT_375127 [Cladorrhinum sp. PSN332]